MQSRSPSTRSCSCSPGSSTSTRWTLRCGTWRGNVGRVDELYGSTVGIVGMGRIGREVAKRLAGWEAQLIYFDPMRLTPELEQHLNLTFVELDELLRTADAVTVHVPL